MPVPRFGDGRRGNGRRGDGRRGHRIPHNLDVLLQHVWPSLNVVLQAYPWRRCLKEPSLLLHELLRRHTRAANGVTRGRLAGAGGERSRASAWLVREERVQPGSRHTCITAREVSSRPIVSMSSAIGSGTTESARWAGGGGAAWVVAADNQTRSRKPQLLN